MLSRTSLIIPIEVAGSAATDWLLTAQRFHFYNPCDILDAVNTDILKEHSMATSIRLDSEVEERLNFLATQTGRTKAFYLRELITRGMEDLEDYYLAADVLERVRKSEEEILSSSDVRRSLDLDN